MRSPTHACNSTEAAVRLRARPLSDQEYCGGADNCSSAWDALTSLSPRGVHGRVPPVTGSDWRARVLDRAKRRTARGRQPHAGRVASPEHCAAVAKMLRCGMCNSALVATQPLPEVALRTMQEIAYVHTALVGLGRGVEAAALLPPEGSAERLNDLVYALSLRDRSAALRRAVLADLPYHAGFIAVAQATSMGVVHMVGFGGALSDPASASASALTRPHVDASALGSLRACWPSTAR